MALPQFLWDYKEDWDEPDWLEQPEFRNSSGLITPEKLAGHESSPTQVDLNDVSVEIDIKLVRGGILVSIEIDSSRPIRLLPLAIWKVPLGPDCVSCDIADNTRWISVIDGNSGNLNGIAFCRDVPTGRSMRQFELFGEYREPVNMEFKVGKQVSGRVFCRDNKEYAYLWRNDGVKEVNLQLSVPKNKKVQAQYVDGSVANPDKQGLLRILLNDDWQYECTLICGFDRTLVDHLEVV